jgi:hypothetical protein
MGMVKTGDRQYFSLSVRRSEGCHSLNTVPIRFQNDRIILCPHPFLSILVHESVLCNTQALCFLFYFPRTIAEGNISHQCPHNYRVCSADVSNILRR